MADFETYAVKIASALSQVYWALGATRNALVPPRGGPYRPPQWVKQKPALTLIPHPLRPPQNSAAEQGFTDQFGQFIPNPSFDPTAAAREEARLKPPTYVFDSVIRADHETQSIITLNPVQNGSPIADHAYVLPPRLTVEIAMSDAMQEYTVGQWSGGPSKSVNAYLTLVGFQRQRMRLSVATRMNQYDDMLISDIRCEETRETRYAGKFVVTFTKIQFAQIELIQSTVNYATMGDGLDSSRADATAATTGGPVQPGPIPAAIQSQNSAPGTIAAVVPIIARRYSVPGAGHFGSLPIF
jgi:hypothetical protein